MNCNVTVVCSAGPANATATIDRKRRDSDCFQDNLRTSGPVLREVAYTSEEACLDLCLATYGWVTVMDNCLFY